MHRVRIELFKQYDLSQKNDFIHQFATALCSDAQRRHFCGVWLVYGSRLIILNSFAFQLRENRQRRKIRVKTKWHRYLVSALKKTSFMIYTGVPLRFQTSFLCQRQKLLFCEMLPKKKDIYIASDTRIHVRSCSLADYCNTCFSATSTLNVQTPGRSPRIRSYVSFPEPEIWPQQ